MVNYVKKCAALLAMALVACAGNPAASGAQFSDVLNKEWRLTEVQTTPAIDFDRDKLVKEGFGDIFVLRFDGERVSGVGAPNRFTAPYTQDGKQDLSIKPAASTLMAPIREPEKLKEHDYFTYLQNTATWELAGGKLRLHTKGADGTDAILVFIEK